MSVYLYACTLLGVRNRCCSSSEIFLFVVSAFLVWRVKLVREGVPFGRVEMETSDELIQQKILKDRQAYALLLMTQFALSLALILWAVNAAALQALEACVRILQQASPWQPGVSAG